MNFQFLKFDLTPGEKYLGIATIRVDFGQAKMVLRHKITPKEDGGFYCQAACHKISALGKDTYVPSFSLDSSYDSEEMRHFVLTNVEQIMQQTQSKSVFGSPAQQQFSQPPQQQNFAQPYQQNMAQPAFNNPYQQAAPAPQAAPLQQANFATDTVPF